MKEVKDIEVTELAEVSNETEAKTEQVVEKKGFFERYKKPLTVTGIVGGIVAAAGIIYAAVKSSKSAEDEYVSFDKSNDTLTDVEVKEF